MHSCNARPSVTQWRQYGLCALFALWTITSSQSVCESVYDTCVRGNKHAGFVGFHGPGHPECSSSFQNKGCRKVSAMCARRRVNLRVFSEHTGLIYFYFLICFFPKKNRASAPAVCVLPWSDALPLFCCSASCSRQITDLQRGGLPVPLTGHDGSHTEIHPHSLSPALLTPPHALFFLCCGLPLTWRPPSLDVPLSRFHHVQLQWRPSL